MTDDSRAELGKRGEDEACKYLSDLGQVILKRNWRYSHLELDIISLVDGDELHIIEVKSRTAPVMAAPELNVNRAKMRKIIEAAGAFLHSPDCKALSADLEVFFDVVTVVFDGPNFEIEYYPKAFIPIYA